MRTLNDIIVVERVKEPEMIGSIIIPQCARDALRNETERGVLTGHIKVAGPDCKYLKVGDKILYHRSQYIPMEHEGEEFSVFHESHVLALVED